MTDRAENKSGMPVPQPGETPGRKKNRRHFFLLVILVALALLFLGEILGSILLRPFYPGLFSASDGVQFIMLNYFTFIGIVIVVLLYCLLAERPLLRSFRHAGRGGQSGNTLKMLGVGLLLGFGTNALCVLAAWLHGDIHLSAGRFDLPYHLFALLIICVQSGAEELLTRGYMLGALRERYGFWAALVLNSLLFAALHLFNPGVTPLAIADLILFGAAMSLVMGYLDSLWMCVAIHTAWNYCQNIFFGLPNSGLVSAGSFLHLDAARESLFYNVEFGVESTACAVATELLLCLIAVLWGRKRKQKRT